MKSGVLVAICVALVAICATARAQSPDALKKAQSAFDQAQLDYLQGKYDEAAHGFQEAYAARPFPQFLYNVGASFHMKGKKTSDVESYKQAVEFYKRYLAEDPKATDKSKVEKAIGVLDDEIKRLTAQPAVDAGSAAGSAAPAQAPSQEVQQLGDVKVRGLVVIVSEPQNATIYLDKKANGPFATTPWSGSLDGDHKVILEKRGYKVGEAMISADPSKLFVQSFSLAQEDYLAWIDVTSNVPGAQIFIDDKSVGAVGKTPLSQNIKPGKHTFWITAEGYDEYSEIVDIAAGETHTIKGKLSGAPVGKLGVAGVGVEDSVISVDDKVLCEHGPCIRSVPQGDHTVLVTRPGYKAYTRRITIEAKTETSIKVGLSPQPSRSDAIVAYVVGGLLGGAGAYAGLQSQKLHDDLAKEIAAGMPPPDSNDPRFVKGKVYAIAADALYGLAGITLLTAIYYTFRDKGSPSTGMMDVKTLALEPQLGAQYAGLGVGGHW